MPPDQKLKVGLVFDDTIDRDDGVSQYVRRLGGWLSGQGHEVRYLVGQTSLKSWQGGKVYSLSRNLRVSFNGNKLSMPVSSDKKAIKQVLADEQFDVLHVMVPYSPFMAAKVINMASAATAIVGTFHILPSGRISRLGSKLLKIGLRPSLKKFDQMAAVSLPAADFAKRAYGLNTSVIPNPIDIDAFKPKPKIKKSATPRIVFLGRLVKRKGCQQLLLAFFEIAPQIPDARLIIAGDGPDKAKLMKMAGKAGLLDRIEFLGHIKESEKAGLLSSATVACFPSLYGESFGIVLIEAMAAGAGAVLGGDNPGYRSVLQEQPDLLVDPLNAAQFASRLRQLLTDEQLRRGLSDWQKQAVKKYDLPVVGGLIENLYGQAIANRNKTSHNNHHDNSKSNG
jgi:phosphatidylinositol alpha-mannosyltransferase